MTKIVKKNVLDLGHRQIYELIETHMQEIIENYNNPNTDPRTTRSLTIKLTFKGDDERQNLNMESVVTPKLAPIKARGISLKNVREVNHQTGQVINVLKEITSEIPGQLNLDGHITEPETVLIGQYAEQVIARAQRAHNAINQDESNKLETNEDY